jgi:hypothetical protein
VLGQRVEHRVAAAAVDVAQREHVVVPVALAEVLGHEQLRQRRGAQIALLLAEVHLLLHGAGRDGPADADPGGEDLRERAEVDDERAAVKRPQRRQRVALVAQEAVRVVLEHQQLALVRDLDEALAPRQRQRHAGRVLEVRDRVDELRAPALAVEPLEHLLERVDAHAVAVHLDLHDVGLVGGERRYRAGVCRRLGDDHVAWVDQRLADEVDHLLAAGRDQHVRGVDLGLLGGHHLRDALRNAAHALGRRVLQCPRAALRGDVAEDRGEALGGERARVGQPAGERNHLGPLGDRHEVPHR